MNQTVEKSKKLQVLSKKNIETCNKSSFIKFKYLAINSLNYLKNQAFHLILVDINERTVDIIN